MGSAQGGGEGLSACDRLHRSPLATFHSLSSRSEGLSMEVTHPGSLGIYETQLNPKAQSPQKPKDYIILVILTSYWEIILKLSEKWRG